MDWHRLFGISLADAMIGAPFRIVLELELAKRKQRLDAAIIRLTDFQDDAGEWPDLPDGLTDLASHNLATFKSIRESLTRASILELVGYFVAYAKEQWQADWKVEAEPPARNLRVLAVTVHRPQWLAATDGVQQKELISGVYEIDVCGLPVRVIVPRELEKSPRNAVWHLLSGNEELIRLGMEHFQPKDQGLYNIFNDLKANYKMEGVEMPYTLEDYKREKRQELLDGLSADERRLIVETLSTEERAQILDKMSAEELEAYLRQRKANGAQDAKS